MATRVTRRAWLGSVPMAAAAAGGGGGATETRSGAARRTMRSLEGSGKVWDIWHSQGRFTKNPDIIRFPSGRMMLVYCDNDQHWAQVSTRITTLESTDEGKTWGNPRIVASADIQKGDERWVTPRLTRLQSGRLVLICDHDDYHYYHEDRPSGIWIWFSDDEGRTWSEPRLTGVRGIEPGRVTEVSDGSLLMNAHMVYRDNYKLAEHVMRSTDGGLTWKDPAIVAKDEVHNFCEGHILPHSSGALACILRENNHSGYPSYVSFSYDLGHSWSKPKPLPFAGDRPFAGEMPDGRVLITYRNQCGNTGTQAWLGDLFAATEGYAVHAVHYGDEASFEDGMLRLHNRPDAETRYIVMPPENLRSNVTLEARLRVDGPAGSPIAMLNIGRLGLTLHVLRDRIWCDFRRGNQTNPAHLGMPSIDVRYELDMTIEHTLRIQTLDGRMWVAVDGKPVIHGVMIREWPLEDTFVGRAARNPGDIWLRHINYEAVNDSEPVFTWSWSARSNRCPDQYVLDRILEINPNPPGDDKKPDNGYSSFVQLPGGDIYMVDYSNRGDRRPMGHLYAARFSVADFETA